MRQNSSEQTELLVIGGGPGGYAAAFMASDLGMQVTLVDSRGKLGGVCLHEGCIPSKSLLYATSLITQAKEAEAIGISFAPPQTDLPKLREWKNSIVTRLSNGLQNLARSRRIKLLSGQACFNSPYTVEVRGEDEVLELSFKYAIIATGSLPSIPSIFKLKSPYLMDSTDALKLEDIPSQLLVVGGGYIGLELGSVYSALGSRVTVVEMLDRLLPGMDAELSSILTKRLAATFEAIKVNTRVEDLFQKDNQLQVTFKSEGGETEQLPFDKVLIATGRAPNSKGLGLERLGIKVDQRGYIQTDHQGRTSVHHIFAIGDVTGQPMLAHRAAHQGRVAAEVIAGGKAAFEPQAIPSVVYTDPEAAWAGFTEEELSDLGIKFRTVRFPWNACGRALACRCEDGLTKLLVDTETERILGIGIVGHGAGDLIAEGVLAIEMAATVKDLELTIHPHPTLSETLMEAASVFTGTCSHQLRK